MNMHVAAEATDIWNYSHPAAKGVQQKESGKKRKKSDRSVRKSDQKMTKRVPKTKKKSDRTPFADLLLRHPDIQLVDFKIKFVNCCCRWTPVGNV